MVSDILLSIHLVAIAFAYGAGFAGGETGRALARAAPEMREPIWGLLLFFFKVKAGAFAVLLAAGVWQFWLRGLDGVAIEWVFWLKMAAVAASVITTALEIFYTLKWRAGDETAFRMAERIGHLTGLSMTTAIVAAVFAF